MKILAVDTSSSVCSVALLEDNELIEKIELNNGRTHSENLMPLVKDLLEKSNLSIDKLDLIACAVGPGSFTGIRIGVASMKPIAEIAGVKMASVTSLEGLAASVENVSEDDIVVSIIDAKNNQVYAGIFDYECNLKEDYIADDINIVIEKLKNYRNIKFVGDASVIHRELLNNSLKNNVISFKNKNDQSAEFIGKIGYKKYLENNLMTSDTIIPIYLRKSQAERLKK